MRLIRVMCSGRVDMSFILRAFSKGIDGVFIGACHLGECNYVTHGNYHTLNTVLLFKRIMEHIGLNPDRLRISFMSGSEANLFVEGVNEFVNKVKSIGQLGKAEGMDDDELKSRLAHVARLVPYIKVMTREKMMSRLADTGQYNTLFTKDEVARLFTETVSYYIDPEKCQACMTCQRRCPAEAIEGGKNLVHVIDQTQCIKCGTCFEACPPRFGSIRKITGEPVPPPLPMEARAIVRKTREKAAG
jgi:F420-non-reducing hydrogenase iron-sulfur subunit